MSTSADRLRQQGSVAQSNTMQVATLQRNLGQITPEQFSELRSKVVSGDELGAARELVKMLAKPRQPIALSLATRRPLRDDAATAPTRVDGAVKLKLLELLKAAET